MQPKHKHFLIIYNNMHKLGGIQRNISIISTELLNRGHSVTLLTSPMEKDIAYEYLGKTHICNIEPRAKKKKRPDLLAIIRLYLLLLRSDRVFDFRESKKLDPIRYYIKKFRARNKTVLVVSNSQIENYIGPNQERIRHDLTKYRNIICLTKEMQDQVESQYKVNNCTIIPNAINTVEIETLKEAPLPVHIPKRYIVASGRLKPVKGFDLLIMAFAKSELPKSDIALVLIGEGKDEKKLKNLCVNLGIEEQVYFEGFTKNPYKYYSQSLFLVLSSRHEAFGNVIIENLYCGKPVIAMDCYSGPRHLIKNNINGLLVPTSTSFQHLQNPDETPINAQELEALTKALNRLFKDEALYAACCRKAKISVQNKYDIKKVINYWIDL